MPQLFKKGWKWEESCKNIGNSRDIRIPKSLIDESGLKNEVELEINEGQIIIRPVSKNRESWDEGFQRMAKNNDDVLLDSETLIASQNGITKNGNDKCFPALTFIMLI